MTKTEWEWFRQMKLSDQGHVATAEQWAVRLNVKQDEIRSGARVPGSQGMLVFVPAGGYR